MSKKNITNKDLIYYKYELTYSVFAGKIYIEYSEFSYGHEDIDRISNRDIFTCCYELHII
ncbi:hypothetical protein M0Q50_08905 [bacterium]|nr:hypothetical protein [bacterium]